MAQFNVFETAKQKRIIVAHRGVSGGNIPPNTIPAYETALKQGADMIEIDVNRTADGVLVINHPRLEDAHLGQTPDIIPSSTYEQVKEFRYQNFDNTPTQFGIIKLDDLLETFKNRCYINVDKFWGCPVEIYAAIKKHGMQDQIVVKSSMKDEVIDVLKDVAPDLAFMPIVRKTHPFHESLMRSGIRYVGAEVLFDSEENEVATPAFIEKMHRDGKLVWVNSIIYNYKRQLAAGHSDDTALCESMEKGWGWLGDRGFDFIQTDWPLMLVNYLKETNRYYR